MSRIDDSGLLPYEGGTVKAFGNAVRHMSHHRLSGDPSVSITLRRPKRVRRISLRVSQLDGRVTLTLPAGVSEREALDFAQEKADWIRGHLARQPERLKLALGDQLPIEGVVRTITQTTGRRVQLLAKEIALPDKVGNDIGPRLEAFLKELARDRLTEASDRHAESLGREFSRITIRDTRSRWGSCSSRGALMYSWRLILAPPDVLDYVAAHEVAHLQEMNHSPEFWAVVERLYGDYAAPRSWLRNNGSALHRFDF